jgi:hypothetical protein
MPSEVYVSVRGNLTKMLCGGRLERARAMGNRQLTIPLWKKLGSSSTNQHSAPLFIYTVLSLVLVLQ